MQEGLFSLVKCILYLYLFHLVYVALVPPDNLDEKQYLISTAFTKPYILHFIVIYRLKFDKEFVDTHFILVSSRINDLLLLVMFCILNKIYSNSIVVIHFVYQSTIFLTFKICFSFYILMKEQINLFAFIYSLINLHRSWVVIFIL